MDEKKTKRISCCVCGRKNPKDWYFRHHKVVADNGQVRHVGGYDYVCPEHNDMYQDALESMRILEKKNKTQNLLDLAASEFSNPSF